jgi:hypothetical protein
MLKRWQGVLMCGGQAYAMFEQMMEEGLAWPFHNSGATKATPEFYRSYYTSDGAFVIRALEDDRSSPGQLILDYTQHAAHGCLLTALAAFTLETSWAHSTSNPITLGAAVTSATGALSPPTKLVGWACARQWAGQLAMICCTCSAWPEGARDAVQQVLSSLRQSSGLACGT